MPLSRLRRAGFDCCESYHARAAQFHTAIIPWKESSGNLTETPTGAEPYDIFANEATGDVWFTVNGANEIGRIAPDGQFVYYTGLTANSGPTGITVDANGNPWWTESNADQIGTLAVDQPLSAQGTSLTLLEGQPFNGTVATFTDPDPDSSINSYTATIDWGDGQQTTGIITQPDGPGTAYAVSGTHVYSEADDYTINLTITDVDTSHDSGGSQATALTPVEVDAGSMTATGVTASSVEGQTFNGVVASFSDSDPYATPSLFTATIDWGDGTSTGVGSSGIAANNQGGFDVTAGHTYTDENTYTATITIYDNDAAGAVVTRLVGSSCPRTGR
jgi:hypothetical protein